MEEPRGTASGEGGAGRAPDWQANEIALLAQGVSTQARVATRYWLATLIAALLVLIPQVPTEDQGGGVELPFGVGRVDESSYYPLAYALLSVLAVALSSAHAQHLRAHKLAHRQFDVWDKKDPGSDASHRLDRRDMFDMLVAPGLTRVAPLSQLLQPSYGFRQPRAEPPGIVDAMGKGYYIVLKVWALIVLFLVPTAALLSGYSRVLATADGWLLWGATAAGAIAVSALFVLAAFDVREVWRIAHAAFAPSER